MNEDGGGLGELLTPAGELEAGVPDAALDLPFALGVLMAGLTRGRPVMF
jgi:hypothetical protein